MLNCTLLNIEGRLENHLDFYWPKKIYFFDKDFDIFFWFQIFYFKLEIKVLFRVEVNFSTNMSTMKDLLLAVLNKATVTPEELVRRIYEYMNEMTNKPDFVSLEKS